MKQKLYIGLVFLDLVVGVHYDLFSTDMIGAVRNLPPRSLGVPPMEVVRISPNSISELPDELITEDIAEVEIDPEAFEITPPKPKVLKKDALDDVQFN